MTRKEQNKAIRILQWLHDNDFLFRSTEEDVKYATKLAIQELKQKPYEDAISRQAVLDAFWKLNIELRPNAIDAILNMINDLPSVNAEKTGR